MYIGSYQLSNNLIVAPMAGVTDRPFRTLCKYFGAGHAVSEMMTADKTLRMSKKSLYRANFDGELAPISAQIAGSDPEQLAEAARYQVANGAQIVDINMGCPAKKVCNKLAGSALLQDEDLVARILDAVVAAGVSAVGSFRYTVTGSDNTTYSDTVRIAVSGNSPNGIKQLLNRIQVYPNPVSDRITISNMDACLFDIYDCNAKLIAKGKTSAQGSNQQIDVQQLPVGVYTLKLRNGKTQSVATFIKN
jgi:hypothetical protein